MKRLTDALLKAYAKKPPRKLKTLSDGAVAGLSIRLGTGGAANWSLIVRVTGEGGGKPVSILQCRSSRLAQKRSISPTKQNEG
jgi:hypothetical protein